MKPRRFLIAALLVAGALSPTAWPQSGPKSTRPAPDFADVSYGPHARNVFDLWLPKAAGPAPLVLYIHGGGFRAGDKRTLGADALRQYLAAGWAVAAINYRFTDTAPAPAAYLDCARALQHLRHHAAQWRIDPRRVVSTGSSAGAGTSLWLAFHDDLADPRSADPVARESTRLAGVVVYNGQSSYDPRFAEKIGIPRPNFERHPFFLPFYSITSEEIDTPKAQERYARMAPITYLTRDDPPAMLIYNVRNEKVTAATELNVIVHHPLFGLALKWEMDALGIDCVVEHRGEKPNETVQEPPAGTDGPLTAVEFIRRSFARIK